MNNIQQIEEHPVYKEIMSDSFGGIMYDVANQNKYDTSEILPMWEALEPQEREAAGGVMNGAFEFLKGE